MTTKEPHNSGKDRSKADIDKLKQETTRNTSTPIIILHLERTEAAVRSMASKLEVSLKPTNQSPYGTRGKRKPTIKLN